MTGTALTFGVGDAVRLKGQTQVMTVIGPLTDRPPPSPGWTWVAHSHTAGTHFNLLPVGALEPMKMTRGRK